MATSTIAFNRSNSQLTIREARKRKGLVQTDLGRLVGLPQVLISYIEMGRVDVPIRDRPKFAWALGLEENQIDWGIR